MNVCKSSDGSCYGCLVTDLYIYAVSASSSELGTFYDPYLPECGCTKYAARNISNISMLNCTNNNDNSKEQFNCGTAGSDYFDNYVDGYGRLLTNHYAAENGSGNGSYTKPGECPLENYTFVGKLKYYWKNGVTEELINTLTYTFPCDPENYNVSPWYGGCGGGTTSEVTCNRTVDDYDTECGENKSGNTKGHHILTLSADQSLQDRYDAFAKNISNKIFSLKKTNQQHHIGGGNIGVCESGGVDDCWSIISEIGFSAPDVQEEYCTASNYQIALKIAISSEDFTKKGYASIKGKVRLYTGGTGGKTPCCSDDFDGTILEEYNFTLNGQNNFNPNNIKLNAQDLGELNSADYFEDMSISICITITEIQFL